MKKKLFVILLSLVMVATMMPLSVFADTANASDNAVTTEEVNADTVAKETESEKSDPSTDYLSFTAIDGDMTLGMLPSSKAPEVTYEYSYGGTWIDFIPGTTTANIAKDQTIYFRAKNDTQGFPGKSGGVLRFEMNGNGKINAGGNIMSLVSKDCSETEMQSYGFCRLFEGCTKLATPPKLPATKLANICYNAMFYGCTNLTKAPDLPAMEMAEKCYSHMFYNCTNLTKAPELPALKLKKECYYSMFCGCKKLEKAPDLFAENQEDSCYKEMFKGCSKLNSISVGFESWQDFSVNKYATENWLSSVAAEGTFACSKELDASVRDASHIPEGWTIKYRPSKDCLSFTAVGGDVTLGMSVSSKAPEVTYEYSSEGETWIDFIPGTTTTNIAKDQTIYFRAKNDTQGFPGKSGGVLQFEMNGNGKINAGGNIMSLVSKDCSETEMQSYGFCRLFEGCTKLATPPKLPATKLANVCYNAMFYGCTNLTKAPDLPAMEMTEKCYSHMFYNCENLSIVPALPATSLAASCYSGMFGRCANLIEVPALPATSLAANCYSGMFGRCANLRKAPELLALKLEEGCYSEMFSGCAKLEKAPDLPAETLAPKCYYNMFYECTKLSSIIVGFKDWLVDGEEKDATKEWLSSVAATGSFTCSNELDASIRDSSHIPEGWKIFEIPPTIPVMTSFKAKAVDSKTCELNWDELKQFEDVKYEVYRGTTSTGYWPKIGETSNNSYTDSTVTSGTKYYYMIRPVVTLVGKEYYGPYSNKDYGYPRINALTGFRVWASDYETANISWNKCLDKDAEFWIYRGTKPTGDWGNVYAKVTKNEATSWSETLTPGSKFYYMVREAVKGNDGKYYFGPYTKVDYAYPRLNAPSGFSAWASDKTTCKCSWTKLPGDGIQYLVYRGNAPTGNWGPAIGSTIDGSYTDKGRTTGHKYYYMVRAKVTVNGKTYFGPYTKVDYGYPR